MNKFYEHWLDRIVKSMNFLSANKIKSKEMLSKMGKHNWIFENESQTFLYKIINDKSK